MSRIEHALTRAIGLAEAPGCPPGLAAAMRASVFPRGARIRPRLCLAVSYACGEDAPALTDAAAAAVELLHCASLVHDDMPCFDDADTRRGRPTVHKAFGEMLALLAGDALIVLAFQIMAEAGAEAGAQAGAANAARLAQMIQVIAAGVGVPRGIVAGQAWECEAAADLAQYQQEKTGALFAAATCAGAAAAGMPAAPWRALGLRLGEAYQVADDIRDSVCSAESLGKPVGQDVVHNRPNAVLQLGLSGAIAWLEELAERAVQSVPACPGQNALRSHILSETMRLVPVEAQGRHAA